MCVEINMNDEDLMNIVNEIFEEIEVDDIIWEMKIIHYLMTVIALVIVVTILQKLIKKL